MNFHIKTTPAEKIATDLLVTFCGEGEIAKISLANPSLSSTIQFAAKKEKFSGKDDESLIIYTKGIIPSYKMIIMGLGSGDRSNHYQMRKAVARAIRKASQMKAASIGIVPSETWLKKTDISKVGQAIVEGAALSAYTFLKYKGEEEKSRLIEIEDVFILAKPTHISALERGIRIGEVFAEGTLFARDLVNEPSILCTPTFLSQTALDIGKASDGLVKVKIYEKNEVEKLGMNSFLGVARGSDEPPKFITLTYKKTTARGKVVVIGKGITFDTGGLSLKGAEHMETMKLDMAGAAAVLGIFKALPILKPDAEVIGLIAACENMPSGKALKPGDILQAMNGKTIEVLNTDAEGRLTLADSLSYAVKLKADAIVDIATLTGACMVALGQEIAGLWGNDDVLITKLTHASSMVGEKVWNMPLEKEYKSLIKSHIADVKNTQTGRYGGAITAALFLNEFATKNPWAHLDIAGPAYEEHDSALVPQGGSGFGVRTILQYLLNI